MFVSPTKIKRFSLYHLEEGESNILDFYGYCSFFDFTLNDHRKREKGKFYVCSKSIVFEADLKTIWLYKFKFEHFKAMPIFTPDGITFTVTRITSIKVAANEPPEPFHINEDLNEKITIAPAYGDVKTYQEWIVSLFDMSRRKGVFDAQEKINAMIIEKFNKKAFNVSLVDSASEKPILEEMSMLTRRVLPLNHLFGYIFITNEKVYFEPFQNMTGERVEKIENARIDKLFKRRYELREIGLEVLAGDKSYYFTFSNETFRNRIYQCLTRVVGPQCLKIEGLQNITMLWQTKKISNYQYLLHLNQAGNRSFSDLSQYPVFPWVLADYESPTINLSDPSIYRDLSKPIGALNNDRLQSFLERYNWMEPPKFMYGTHYSTPGFVIGYLLRKKPQYMLKLQSGRFDKPDRLFKSIQDDWQNVYQQQSSLKELIPQFYGEDASFLRNGLGLDLGVRQNKKRVDQVKVPLWANEDPDQFLRIMREALESDYVSQNLHHWIDLIFGYKQRGPEAIKANNLFHYLTYEGTVDIEAIKDPIDRIGLRCQINEFGQCPKQIFLIPHPPRNSLRPIMPFDPSQLRTEEEEQDSLDFRRNEGQQREDRFGEKSNSQTSYPHTFVPSAVFVEGVPKVKAIISMGRQSDVKCHQIQKAHKRQNGEGKNYWVNCEQDYFHTKHVRGNSKVSFSYPFIEQQLAIFTVHELNLAQLLVCYSFRVVRLNYQQSVQMAF